MFDSVWRWFGRKLDRKEAIDKPKFPFDGERAAMEG